MCLICLEVGFLLVCNVAHNCYHCTVNGFTCLEAGYGELLLTHLSCLAAPTDITCTGTLCVDRERKGPVTSTDLVWE